MMFLRKKVSRLASWGLFLGVLFTVGTGFDPGSLTRSGCERPFPNLRVLEGLVVDAGSGLPIAGARVTAEDQEATTDGSGKYRLHDLSFRRWTLRVSAPGYVPSEEEIDVTSSSYRPPTIRLARAPDLAHDVRLPVQDISTCRCDALTASRGAEPFLEFESATATLAGQTTVNAFVEFDLTVIPPGATLEDVTLHATLVPGSGPIGGGGGGATGPGRLGTRSTQDDDIVVEAYAVLEAWDEDELKFMNQPREFLETPVAAGVIPATTGEPGFTEFTMDLTRFANDLRSRRLLAHGFVLATHEVLTIGGVVGILTVTSSEYTPDDHALRITARYRTADGQKAEVVLR